MTIRVLRNFLFLPAVLAACASLGMAQTGAMTRVEQNDPSIIYSGGWYSNANSLDSSGTDALTNTPGAQAVITFSGTGITWVGVSDPYSGIAWVYLDGALNTVDTYSSATLYQQPLFSAMGLASGSHTLSIYVPHIRDVNTNGSWVWIDSFEIENGSSLPGGVVATLGRTEQNSAALNFTGNWSLNTNPQESSGSAALSVAAGSRATLNFNGTGIAWIAYRDQYSGIANVYLDGVLQPPVDTYLSPAQFQSPAYAINGLPAGPHSLTIEVTGTQNSSSGGSWIWVDAFDVPGNGAGSVISSGVPLPSGGPAPLAGGATQILQNNSAIVYGGNWYANHDPGDIGGSAVLAMNPGATATVKFTGTGIQWIGVRDEWSGIAAVSLDGGPPQNVDEYLTPGAQQQVIYKASGLDSGTHTLTIAVTGTANPSSKGDWIWVNAFDVTP